MGKQVCSVDIISSFLLCEIGKRYQFQYVNVDACSGYGVATVLHVEVCSSIYQT